MRSGFPLDAHLKGGWKNYTNHKVFFDWLGNKLGYKELNDWYKITGTDITQYGGSGLISEYYNNSPSKALQCVYPHHEWMIWRFKKSPHKYWENISTIEQAKILDWLSDKLSITCVQNWNRVSLEQIHKLTST